jgi:hypothetical protein
LDRNALPQFRYPQDGYLDDITNVQAIFSHCGRGKTNYKNERRAPSFTEPRNMKTRTNERHDNAVVLISPARVALRYASQVPPATSAHQRKGFLGTTDIGEN